MASRDSAEFQERYGTLDNAGFTTLLYNNVLGRQPDSAGLAAWTASINSGKATRRSRRRLLRVRRAPEPSALAYIDDGIMLYGEDGPTPGAVASSGQSVDQVGLVGAGIDDVGAGFDFRCLRWSGRA